MLGIDSNYSIVSAFSTEKTYDQALPDEELREVYLSIMNSGSYKKDPQEVFERSLAWISGYDSNPRGYHIGWPEVIDRTLESWEE